jgi:folate-binding protein YgfZ
MTLLENYKSLRLIGNAENIQQMLQGQLTSDIYEVTESYSQLSAMCDEKGFVIADMFVSKEREDCLLTLHESLVDTVSTELERYLPFYKVSCEIDSRLVIGIIKDNIDKHCYFKNKQKSFGLEFLSTAPSDIKSVQEWRLLHWQQGIYFLQDFIKQGLRPQEIGFEENRISFSKGCYRGQEIIARMHYLNKKKMPTSLMSSEEKPEDKNILSEIILHENLYWFLQKSK